MAEEVKINIQAATDGAAAKVQALKQQIAELRQHGADYEKKYGAEDSRTKSVRSEADQIERRADHIERDIARSKREQHASEKDITRERREQAGHAKTEETQRQRFGRAGMQLGMQAAQGGSLAGGLGSLAGAIGPGMLAGVGAVAAVAIGTIAKEVWTDIHERQGIALRDQAARKMNQYDRSVMAGVRGTSGQSQAAEDALDRQIEQRAADRQNLASRGERDPWNPLRWFGSKQTFASQRELAENDKAQTRDKEEREKKHAQTGEKFENEEGGLQLDALRQRAKRTMSGQREAFMDEYLARALEVKRAFRGQGATPEQQNEAAQLDMTNSLRARQLAAGSGLVNARSGAGDIAAAARWGSQTTPMEAEAVKRLDGILGKMDRADAQQKHVDQSIPAPRH